MAHCKANQLDTHGFCNRFDAPCIKQNCRFFGVITNADRIRAMTDEELAKLFTQAVADGCPPKMDWDCAKGDHGWDACDACWCKWLQQPAEDK